MSARHVSAARAPRRLLAAAVAVAALAGATGATAAYAPELGVASGSSSTTVTLLQSAIDAPTARVVVSVPASYAMNGGVPPALAGRASAVALASDLGGSSVRLTGAIAPASAADVVAYGGTTAALSALAQACTGIAGHDGYATLQLSGSGSRLTIPIYVDAVAAGSPAPLPSAYTLTLCLPAPDVPIGTPDRAPGGDKLTELTLELDGVSTGTTGWHLWLARLTPYTPGLGAADAGATVEAQALDRTPAAITLSATPAGTGAARVSGRIVAGGNSKGLGGETVVVSDGDRVLAWLRTGAGGRYSGMVRLAGGSETLTASGTVPLGQLAPACSSITGAPCSSLAAGGFTVASKPVSVGG